MIILLMVLLLCMPNLCYAEVMDSWVIVDSDGNVLTQICYEPSKDDEYIAGDNKMYQIISIENKTAYAKYNGMADMPSTAWMDIEDAMPVMAEGKKVGIYCTHSDESFEPSDGYYTTRERGTIYEIAQSFADELDKNGIAAEVDFQLHHPHDAGAYRRSRQTAIRLLKEKMPDCLIDIHRDGIPDPASYQVTIGGNKASKIRLLVGRENQNSKLNKEFAMMIKAVADRVYPGLIKDIYMGKGSFNQDLLPGSLLLECGTYTLEKERVLTSMPMIANVMDRVLNGGITGSVGRTSRDVQTKPDATAPITQGKPDPYSSSEGDGMMSGFGFLGIMLGIGIIGLAILSAGSWQRGTRKSARNLSEMTGGLLGKRPDHDEDPEHS